jgi:hypothetical protein
MDNDEDDGVGQQLKQIRVAQARAMASDDDEEEEEDDEWKQAKLFHASQGFSKDLSQPSQQQQQQPPDQHPYYSTAFSRLDDYPALQANENRGRGTSCYYSFSQ